MSNNGKNIHEIPEIGVFLDSNLNFTIGVFTLGLANDLHICKKKYEKRSKHILSNLIYERMQYLICERSHNGKVLQLA